MHGVFLRCVWLACGQSRRESHHVRSCERYGCDFRRATGRRDGCRSRVCRLDAELATMLYCLFILN